MTSKKNINLEFINLLYVIGALFVVLGHSTANYIGNWGAPNLVDSNLMILLHEYIYTFHMPLFFFISGFVFNYNYNRGKYRSFKPFVAAKAKRLLIPYFLIGIFYVSPMKLLIGDYTLSTYLRTSMINILLGVNPSQLWYLIALFNVFIIYHISKNKLDSFSNKWYIDILLLVIFASFTLFIDTGLAIFQIEATLNNLLYFHIGYLSCQYIKTLYNFALTTTILLVVHAILFATSRITYMPVLEFVTTIIGIYAYYSLAITLTSAFRNLNNSWLYEIIRKHNLNIYLFHQQIIQLLLVSVLSEVYRLF